MLTASKRARRWIPFDAVELVSVLLCVAALFAIFHAQDLYHLVGNPPGEHPAPMEARCRALQTFAERLENQTYDSRLQIRAWLRPTPMSPDLVLLAVDDHAVEQYGRWPWPRSYWSHVMEALTDVGVRALCFDVLFSDPAPDSLRADREGRTYVDLIRQKSVEIEKYLHLDGAGRELVRLAAEDVDPATREKTLTTGVEAMGSYVSRLLAQMSGELESLVHSQDGEFAESLRIAREQGISAFAFTVFEERRTAPRDRAQQLWATAIRQGLEGQPATPDADPELTKDLTVAALLSRQFAIQEEDIALSTGLELVDVFARTRKLRPFLVRWALEKEIEARSKDPVVARDTEARSLVRAAFERLGVRGEEPDFAAYVSMVPEVLGAQAFRERFPWEIAGTEALDLAENPTIKTTIPRLLIAMEGSGAGNAHFDPDGVMRRIPLLWAHQGRVYPHMGLAAGARILGADPRRDIRVEEDGRLMIGPAGRSPVVLPLDAQGRMIVPWSGSWDEIGIPVINIAPVLRYGFLLTSRHARLGREHPEILALDEALARIGGTSPTSEAPMALAELLGEAGYQTLLRQALTGRDEVAAGDPEGRSVLTARTREGWNAYLRTTRDEWRRTLLQNLRVPRDLLRMASYLAAYLEGAEFPEGRAFREAHEVFKKAQHSPDAAAREVRPLVLMSRRLARAFEKHLEASGAEGSADSKLGKLKDQILPSYWKAESQYAELIERVDELRDELAGRLGGKVLMIGDIQTSGTDIGPMPLQEKYPKVGLQATVLSSVMTGQAIRTLEQVVGNPLKPLSRLLVRGLLWLLFPVLLLWILPRMDILAGNRLVLVTSGLYILFCTMMLALSDMWIPLVGPVLAMVATVLCITLRHHVTEGRQKRFIRGAFERFVSPNYVEMLVNRPELLALGGEEKEVTIMFSDLEGFTHLAEKMAPTALIAILNQYHDGMAKLIHKGGGTVSQYGGDSIYAFWNAPIPQEDHAARAMRTALELVAFVHDLSLKLQSEGVPALNARIGVNSGPAVVGNVGSEICFNYCAIGDTTNLASRIEGINKYYRTAMLVSQTSHDLARDGFLYREIDIIRVKGRDETLTIFEVIAVAGTTLSPPRQEFLSRFQMGLLSYRDGEIRKALASFERCHELEPADGPTGIYLERCRSVGEVPAGQPWDPVFNFTVK